MRIVIKKPSKWYLSTVTWSLRNPKLYILAQNCLSTSNWKSASGFTSSSLNYLSLFVQLLIACWFWAESSIFTPLIPPKKHCNHSYSLDCKLELFTNWMNKFTPSSLQLITIPYHALVKYCYFKFFASSCFSNKVFWKSTFGRIVQLKHHCEPDTCIHVSKIP